jgi:L-ascorbate metabolism protein UlaG (beta-lactamase superfamily)
LLLLWIIAGALGSAAIVYLLIDRALSAPGYRGQTTDHFDGRKFHNLEGPPRRGFLDFLRWQFTGRRGDWKEWSESQPGLPPPVRVDGEKLRVTFVNHATVLIQTGSVNILTDPIWSDRASPFIWAGPKRHRSPGLRFEDLPPIDFVLLSHNHYDHLDISTLTRLKEEHRPQFISALGSQALLHNQGITDAIELDWWGKTDLSDQASVICVPAKHFSGRGLSDFDRTLWCGFVIQANGGNIYFAGDTATGKHFKQIKEQFGHFRLALLPIGAYMPQWFMHPVHLSPSEAVEVHRLMQPNVSVAIHFGTFVLGDDGEFEPVNELRVALASKDEDSNFWVLEHGEGRNVP